MIRSLEDRGSGDVIAFALAKLPQAIDQLKGNKLTQQQQQALAIT